MHIALHGPVGLYVGMSVSFNLVLQQITWELFATEA